MPAAHASSRWLDACWFFACAALSSLWCITAANELGATFDEPVYLQRGLEFWHSGRHGPILRMGTMPLPIDLCTLPLALFEKLRGEPIDLDAKLAEVLPLARYVTLGFWWLLLWYAWKCGRLLAGPWGARLAVALLAAEPTLLAHACLATTDVPVAACLVAFAYYYRTGRESGWRQRVGLPAVWCALTILAKASGLAFVPLCMAAIELERWWRVRQSPERKRGSSRGEVLADAPGSDDTRFSFRRLWRNAFLRDARQIYLLGLVGVFLYCGCEGEPQQSVLAWAQKLPDTPANRAVLWTAEHVRIFHNAGDAIVRQMRHNFKGHDYYFLGEARRGANRLYFPTALSIKLTLTLLFLPIVVGLLRPRALFNSAALAALALLIFSLNCRVQIGVRFMLPLVALAAIGTAAAIADAVRDCPDWRRIPLGVAAASGLAWSAWASFSIWPQALCYTNELWGGTERGYLHLSDSNYDWGQGLPELERWRQAHGVENLTVWYFGDDSRLKSLPIRDLRPQDLQLESATDARGHLRGQLVAVSTTHLYGAYFKRPAEQLFHAIFLSEEPVARTTTYLIYDFRE